MCEFISGSNFTEPLSNYIGDQTTVTLLQYVILPAFIIVVCISSFFATYLNIFPIFDRILHFKIIPPIKHHFIGFYLNHLISLTFGEVFIWLLWVLLSAFWVPLN
jgi:hypothetical protein